MEKVLFALDIEDNWPPVGSEGVWCDVEDGKYKLLNAPFFIKGLACGDVFTADLDSVNEHIFKFEVVRESGHSLVWMMNTESIDLSKSISKLKKLGCKIEHLENFDIYSLDLPPSVNVDKFDKVTELLESKGVAIAYPVWRFDD